MPIKSCRACGGNLYPEPILRFDNMPKAAQFFPDASQVGSEKGVDLTVCQCAACGLVQLANDPVPYYREVVRAAAVSEEMKAFRLGQFSQFLQKYNLVGKKVLEFGCGKGEYLSIMRACGADAYGVEQGADSVAFCQREGLQVEQGFVFGANYKLKAAPFDAFFTLNFLEHLPDPKGSLGGIAHNLVEGGIGLVEVPNFDMMLRQELFSEFINDHLFYFTKDSMVSLLAQCGFEVLECGVVWHEYIISAIVRKRKALDLEGFRQRQAGLKRELQSYIANVKGKGGRVAVWGAGHQALAVISLAGIGGMLEYVVDSAPFKQGKYTPASHVKTVPPETLYAEPVQAVIVMAGSYASEVADIIRKRHGAAIEVMVLSEQGLRPA